jgi:hypothetical protein
LSIPTNIQKAIPDGGNGLPSGKIGRFVDFCSRVEGLQDTGMNIVCILGPDKSWGPRISKRQFSPVQVPMC